MKTAKLDWQLTWVIIASPFAYVTILCSLVGYGPATARKWAKHCGLPWCF
jgi:hypothetical protein